MKLRLIVCFPVLAWFGIAEANATNIVPITSLTKQCKPLIDKNRVIEAVTAVAMNERTYARIARALEKMSDEKYDEAILLLTKIFDSSNRSNVRSNVAKYIGIAYSRKNDPVNAAVYLEQALELGKGYMQHKELQDLTQNVASLHYSNGNKSQALKLFETWMKNSNVDNAQVYLLYADTLQDSGRIAESICPAYWSAKVANTPQKNALNILLNGHYQLQEYKGSIAVLKQLILDFSEEKSYWRNLASVYVSQDMIEDGLAVMELFYVQEMMDTENDYLMLSQMFSYNNIPYRTAVILQEGIDKGIVKDSDKNWNDIASNFHIAGELNDAISAYEKSSVKTNTGEIDFKRAELLADINQFERAIDGFDAALQKGGLEDIGKVHFRKGIALYGLKQYDSAIVALQKANKYSEWRVRSEQWAKYIGDKKRQSGLLTQF